MLITSEWEIVISDQNRLMSGQTHLDSGQKISYWSESFSIGPKNIIRTIDTMVDYLQLLFLRLDPLKIAKNNEWMTQ